MTVFALLKYFDFKRHVNYDAFHVLMNIAINALKLLMEKVCSHKCKNTRRYCNFYGFHPSVNGDRAAWVLQDRQYELAES
jgi:hypothetical protein